jgi:hypothetical protein
VVADQVLLVWQSPQEMEEAVEAAPGLEPQVEVAAQEGAVLVQLGRMEKPEMATETAAEVEAVALVLEVFMLVEVPVLQVQ